jgi:hypothetical protein
VDLDEVEGILGAVAVGGDDDGDRLADIAHAIRGDGPAVDRRLDPDHEARGERHDVGPGEHRENAVRRPRRLAIDGFDLGVRMRRAQDRGLQSAGAHAEIVDIAAPAGQQRRIFNARDRAADPARRPLPGIAVVAVRVHRACHQRR